jgi:outer membrane cobalamin receptor
MSPFLVFAGEPEQNVVKGKITDSKTGEPLIGATVTLVGIAKTYTSISVLDGSYHFKNILTGAYTEKVHLIGYDDYETTVELRADTTNNSIVNNIQLEVHHRELSSVTVSARVNRESEEYALKTEKLADNVMNVVSAKAIELSPDITVGNVLQRVSGVSTTRSGSGDGQYAIIRGMDKRYSYTSVNGIILPSPDDKNRSVPMDMFPADMIERLEVVKALTPNMDADAIGGATNLVMKNAPNQLTVNGNLAAGYNNIFSSRPFSAFSRSGINWLSPSEINGVNYQAKVSDFTISQLHFHNVAAPINIVGGLSIGNRVFNKKLGYMFAASYSRQYRGSNSLFYEPNGQPSPDPTPNTPVFLYIHNREYSTLQSRLGVHAKFDYAISPDHKINLYALFLQLDDNENRHEEIIGVGNSTGEVDYHDRVTFQRKNLYNVSLNGNDKIIKNLYADWTLSYAIATSKTPDWVDLVYFKDSVNSSQLYASPLTHTWDHSHDRDKSAYLNFTYTPAKNIEFKAGGLYRAKDRDNYRNDYTLSTAVSGGTRQPYTNIDNVIYSFPSGYYTGPDSSNGLNYNGTETVTSGYLQGKITLAEKWQVLAGVREEITHQYYFSQLPVTSAGKTGTIDYADILPGLHIKYKVRENQNLRLSYFAGISRPAIYELVPGFKEGDDYPETGNPNLKHTTSDNIDLRYENFFNSTDHLFAGIFYKNIANPIEKGFILNGSYPYYEPLNPGSNATNYGFELAFSKFIGKWGITGNYSYTHSSITTSKAVEERDSSHQIIRTSENQTRPLQGQADHIANLSLLYKDAKAGFELQLTWVYTGKRISVVSAFYGMDYWERATSQVDFSGEKTISRHWTVFAKVTNLLNNHLYQDILKPNDIKGNPFETDDNRILVQRDVFNQSFLVGFRFKM